MTQPDNSGSNSLGHEPERQFDLPFTGERVIPGKVEPDLFNEHFARYAYAQHFCTGKYVLDTGCGVGYGSRHLAETALSVVGIDADPLALRYANSHFQAANVSYMAGDCQVLPFDSGSFDVVISFELIEHLPDAEKYLAEVKRVLKSDGIFVVSTPNTEIYSEHRAGEANPFHVREWNLGEFTALLNRYFPSVQVLGETHFVAVGILPTNIHADVPAHLQEGGAPEGADYFVCVCGREPISSDRGLVFVPAASNVLLERERHIRALSTELAERNTYLSRLQPEFEEKARWADSLNVEVSRLQGENRRLEAENRHLNTEVQILTALWRKATRWKRMLASVAILPADAVVAFVIFCCEYIGRFSRLVVPRKAPTFSQPKQECSVIIVSWNGKDLLAESLPRLVEEVERQGGNHEIIVVDNGSVDGTSEFVTKAFPGVVLVRSDQNLYFGGGNRLGLHKATRDILVLLNNDMIVQPGFLNPLLQPFSDADVFGVASQVSLPPGKPRQETGKTRADFNGSDLEWRHEPITASDELNEYTPVFWLHGGATAIDRRKYLWLGGLDELYDPFYVEDADLSYRAWKVGWRCLLASHSRVLHKHRSSTQRFGEGFIRQIVRRNHYIFLWKNFDDLGILARHFLHATRIRARRAGVPGVGVQRELRAYFGALRRLPSILMRRIKAARSIVHTDQQIIRTINEPRPCRITLSEVDFARGEYDDYLRGRWYEVERPADASPYRWIGQVATLFLVAPAENLDLVLDGYVPPLANYPASPLLLTTSVNGRQQQVSLQEGVLSQRWSFTGLRPGEPVRIDFELNQTIRTDHDVRTLGLMVRRVALLPVRTARNSDSSRPAPRPERLRIRGAHATNPDGPLKPTAGTGRKSTQARVLVLCAYLPCLGVHSGGNTMFNLISRLGRRHRLTVLSFYESESELEHIPALSQHCETLEVLYRGQSFETANVWGIKPAEIIHEFYHSRMQRLVERYLATGTFDVIQCEFLQMAHFANAHPTIPAVLTNHELLSLSYRNLYRKLRWRSPQKISALIHWMRILNYEEQILRRFSAVVVLTRPEREFLARYAPNVRVYDHPTGVDTDFFQPTGRVPRPQSLIFVGNFRHAPNIGGVTWLLEKVWPRLRACYPAASFTVAGDNPPAAVREWHGRENVVVTGWVDDVRPFLEDAAVFAAPLFDGVGLRGKVLEAWSMARPVVGTKLAFEALKNREGETGLTADAPDVFADSVQRLWDDPQLAAAMGQAARRLVQSAFSWDAFAQVYDAIYQEILSGSTELSIVAPTILQEAAKQA